MKKVGVCLFILVLSSAAAWAMHVSNSVPHPKLDEPSLHPTPYNYPASKDAGDSIIGNVHIYQGIYTANRVIDYDPTSVAAFAMYRDANSGTGNGCNYIGTVDTGAHWLLIPDLNTGTSVRYPAACADLVSHKPWAVYNTGIGASAAKGCYFTRDEMGYNGGLWDPEAEIDSLGAGSGTNGMYVGTLYRGSNGIVHYLINYWGDANSGVRPGVLYYRSTDSGATWNVTAPRYPTNLKFYNLGGSSDSNSLFGAGNPVIKDSSTGGFNSDAFLWGTETGDTLMIGDNGIDTAVNPPDPLAKQRFWYRMSYDAGVTWTPLTWGPELNDMYWDACNYDFGGAIDKIGQVHFGNFWFRDSSASHTGPYGPLSGLYDWRLTPTGWESHMVRQVDSMGDNVPQFVTYGLDPAGNLFMSYRDNATGSATNVNIWLAWSTDNGATWTNRQVTHDGLGYDFPHIPRHIGGPGSKIPVWYDRANGSAGFVTWVPWDSTVGVAGSPTQPTKSCNFALNRAYPNPASVRTTISFTLPKAGDYSLKVYNIAGQLVRTACGRGVAGQNTAPLSTQGLANGVFFYQLRAGGNVATKKLVVVR